MVGCKPPKNKVLQRTRKPQKKTGMKDGTAREDDIPVSMLGDLASDAEGVLDEEVDGKTQLEPMKTKVDESHWHPSEPHELPGKNFKRQWREGLEKLVLLYNS